MTATFRKIYNEASAVEVIEAVETLWKVKLQKQTSTLGQGLLSFGIFHTSSSAGATKKEDVPETKTTNKLE